ncbi:MAG: hypothetical protein ACXABY_34610 [Candidatus Thorarchaeota archaeon]|jgi:hypothetical protein
MSAKERARVTKSIIWLAAQCNLDEGELLECIREAGNSGESRCGEHLTITCRNKTNEAAIFLFEAERVLSQFPIPIEILRRPERRVVKVLHRQDF